MSAGSRPTGSRADLEIFPSSSILLSHAAPAEISEGRPQEAGSTAFLELPWHARVRALECEVFSQGARVLSGNTLKIDEFERLGPDIVRAGLATQEDVDYVLNGIRHGFGLGVDDSDWQSRLTTAMDIPL